MQFLTFNVLKSVSVTKELLKLEYIGVQTVKGRNEKVSFRIFTAS